MTKKELISAALEELGYAPLVDKEGDLVIHFQMKAIYVIVGKEEETYSMLVLPQFYGVEAEEKMLDLCVCNKLTRDMKLVKVYLDSTDRNISASCEFYYTDKESLKNSIHQSLNVLGLINSSYIRIKEELKGELLSSYSNYESQS